MFAKPAADAAGSAAPAEPPSDCARCVRLVAYRAANRAAEPTWHNAPVVSFGLLEARLLIVGLAPGVRGANRTGRPFTGDYAGELLYETLARHGFSRGTYAGDAHDGLTLADCMITNAVRCVPPENKPIPAEIHACRTFLAARIASLPRLAVIMALGRIAHESTLSALGCRKAAFPFAHGAAHRVREDLTLYDSYHCSRYNTNTGRLTPAMFDAVLGSVRAQLRASGEV